MERLFTRAWFSRIWVIQELKNSKCPLFYCGDDCTYVEEVIDCCAGHGRGFPIPYFPPAPIQMTFPRFERLFEACTTPAHKMFLLVTATGLCKATDPRDRIFALVPLIKNLSDELRGIINYNLDVDEVFRRFALFLLDSGGLALLRMVQHPRPGPLPSWVPDWSSDWEASTFDELIPDFFLYHESRRSRYHDFIIKSGGSEPDQLIVKGARQGYIVERGPLFHTGERDSVAARIQAATHIVHTLERILWEDDNNPDWPESIREGTSGICETYINKR